MGSRVPGFGLFHQGFYGLSPGKSVGTPLANSLSPDALGQNPERFPSEDFAMRTLIRAAAAAWAVVAAATVLHADAKKAEKDATPFSDDVFVVKAASGGKLEVALGKLAKERGASDGVKKFGERMVTDHSKANKELEEVAKKANLGLPVTLLSGDQENLARLSALTGAEFDKQYAAAMVKDHKTDVALFERASKEAKNADLKAFAGKTLPTLKEHLKMAEGLSKGSGK